MNQAFKIDLIKVTVDPENLIAMPLMRTYMKLHHSDPAKLLSAQGGISHTFDIVEATAFPLQNINVKAPSET